MSNDIVIPDNLLLAWPSAGSLAGAKLSAVGADPVWDYAGDMYSGLVNIGVNPPWHTGKGVWCGPQATDATLPDHIPPGITMPSAAGTSGDNGMKLGIVDDGNFTLSRACTVALLVTLGYSSDDQQTISNHMSWSNSTYNVATLVTGGTKYIAQLSNTAQAARLVGTWNTGETHLVIGTISSTADDEMRVGVKRIGIDDDVVWSNWAYVDPFLGLGFIQPFRAGYTNTMSKWLKGLQVWNETEVSEANIEKQFKAMGVM